MASTGVLSYVMRVLGALSPQILACVVGLVVSCLFLSRCKTPAMLVLVGCIVGLVTAFGTVGLQAIFIMSPNASMGTILWSLGILRGLGFAGAFGLTIAAAFSDRGPGDIVAKPIPHQ